MKLTFEVHGYMITIEETEENTIKVSAMQDDEVVEEFELESGEEDMEDMDSMDDEEGMEELPEEGEEIEGEAPESDFEEVPEEEGEATKLESFASFLKKKK
jgi:hypothetical protein